MAQTFIGWPLSDAMSEAEKKNASVESILRTSPPRQQDLIGTDYIIQEKRTIDGKLVWTTAPRLMGHELIENNPFQKQIE